jgi:serine/threonine protein kinase
MQDREFVHQPDTEPIPGYRLIHPLGRGGFGEVWKCEAPGGLLKAIKFVPGRRHALDDDAPAEEELRASGRVKAIRHPAILSMERVENVSGELVIVLELADRNLADVLRAEQEAGRPGIPREPLLAWLREAAEALDVMHLRHGLQHLDVKPQNLFLVSNHVKVGDFGLVNSFTSSDGKEAHPDLGAITPLYAAPEVFQGVVSPHCDQYSLAIVYQQLLTGTLPFAGKNARQLLLQHTQAEPDLQPLPAGDREVLARALGKSPGARYPSCSDFVQALLAGLTEALSSTITTGPLERAPSPSALVRQGGSRRGAQETRRTPAARTVATRTLALRPPAPPSGARFSGLQLEALLSRTPLSEVWSARTEAGQPRLVKVLFAGTGPDSQSASRLAALRHPFLQPIDVLHHAPGRLVLCTPPGDRSLRDVLAECQRRGQPGVRRDRLLAWLKTAAEALDFLARQGLHHLALNPRTLVLEGDRLLLADFGLSQLVWLPAGHPLTAINPRYSAPELFRRGVGPACDQYSLALIYHELLTGAPCPAGGSAAPAGRKGEPGGFLLDRLPEPDRPLIARALLPDPVQRWPGALHLVQALEATGPSPLRRAEVSSPGAPAPSSPGQVLQTRFGATLPAEVIRRRLEGFRQQWQGQVRSSDSSNLVFRMQTPRTFWQRWTGKQPGLCVHLHIGPPEMDAPAGVQTRTEIRMDLEPYDCTPEQCSELLRTLGPLLVESVRVHLRQNPRGRLQERSVWRHALHLCPVGPDGSFGPPVECQGKDISPGGIGFYLPGPLPASRVVLHLPRTEQAPKGTVPARIVRVQGRGEGWYDVGAVLLPHERPEGEPTTASPAEAAREGGDVLPPRSVAQQGCS